MCALGLPFAQGPSFRLLDQAFPDSQTRQPASDSDGGADANHGADAQQQSKDGGQRRRGLL